MKKGLIIGGVFFLAVVIFMIGVFGYFISTKNKFVAMEEDIKSKWAQVDNQLLRRNDLIPNLVNTVKGYAAHEKGIFENIANARSKLAGAQTPEDKMKAHNEMSGFLSRLLMVVENYPNLKADANFRALQDELSGTENRLSVERKRYNDSVQMFNTQIKLFPGSIVAGMSGMKDKPYFEIPQEAKAAPKVNFQ